MFTTRSGLQGVVNMRALGGGTHLIQALVAYSIAYSIAYSGRLP
jgi:hypothetical protein